MNFADQAGLEGPEAAILAQLAREERVRDSLGAVLPHLVGGDDAALLGEEPVIRTRALIAALAADLLHEAADGARVAELARALAGRPALLAHCHALAIEGVTAERLVGIDPVLSPLLEGLLAGEPEVAALAMTTLTAQTRFVCRQRRLETVAAELPAALMHAALVALADLPGGPGDAAAAPLREAYDEGRTRLSLLARLALAGWGEGDALLDPARAGLALFCTALSGRAGVARDEVVLACAPGQYLRLALLMRSAGANGGTARAALGVIHPQADLPGEWLDLPGHRAAALLAGATA